jgi:Domain of unknown function (DUF4157)
VDTAETELAVFERARHAPVPECPAPAQSPRHSPAERLAGDIGNRGMARVMTSLREGEGITAGGLVHPDVEAAIAASQGAGRPLERTVSERMQSGFQDSLGDVRVHADDHAAALARAVSARAFTVGSDIFFGAGEYRPGTHEGQQLIAHEVAHVIQQRGAPMAGPLTVSQPGDALEREAEAVARDVGA